jgi:dTDP-4-amino-4,6-dideoxygalactose transaminase
MIGPRRQPPVVSHVTPSTVLAAARVAARRYSGRVDRGDEVVRSALSTRYDARAVALTDSGTSALVIALRLAVPPRGTVALPAYGCVDLIAAAVRARVWVRLYDIDPVTLSPDLESVRRALARGADAIVVAHFYGYPADMPALRALADAAGARVIEDAAQHAGGRLGGTRLGAFGPLTVLSFGRGKGTTGGRGGALLATADAGAAMIGAVEARGRAMPAPAAGWGEVAIVTAQWAFGRPAGYGLAASIPGLHLGETIYHPAGEPGPLSRAAAALVRRGLPHTDAERLARASVAESLTAQLGRVPSFHVVQPIPGSAPGYLRLAALDEAGRRPAPLLGVVRSYPRPLGEEPELAPIVHRNEPDATGARDICRKLFTLPVHEYVGPDDQRAIIEWACSGAMG